MKLLLFPACLPLLALLLLLGGCQQNDPTPQLPGLPAHTQAGANTLGCYVNGRPWLPATTTPALTARVSPGRLLLQAVQGTGPDATTLRIELSEGFHGAGTYALYFPDWAENVASYTVAAGSQTYFADSLGGSQLIITRYDSAQGILAGSFAFRGTTRPFPNSAVPADTLRISDGRFDLLLH